MTLQHDGPNGGRRPAGPPHYVVGATGDASRPVVGGKAAQLAQLIDVAGVRVPTWFCVTTAAYRRVVAEVPSLDAALDELARLGPDDQEALREVAERLRRGIEQVGVPDDVARQIAEAVDELGGPGACAVRSSATAEDLPSSSFAGMHDSHLNVVGFPAILHHVSRCWSSLFSERAVRYRMQHGVDHRSVEMAVIVQQLVRPLASGVLFTADPVSGNRKVATVEATLGLGDALVSGTVTPDVYRVRDGRIIDRTVATKPVSVRAVDGGGTREDPVPPHQQTAPALTDQQVLELVELGRRIESRLGCPQDVEWCFDGEGVQVVQSRPITTLFPIPEADDDADRVYVSVGHQQMMTEPMTPLGISVWQLTSPAPMRTAGGRLYIDVTARLSTPTTRAATLEALGRSDPLIRDALEIVLERGFVPLQPDADHDVPPPGAGPKPRVTDGSTETEGSTTTDAALVAALIEENRASVAELRRVIRTESGPSLFEFIVADLGEFRALGFDPRSYQALMAGYEARWWLDEHLEGWLGERNPADVLSLAAPGNVTAEMGLALLDVADVVRAHPAVVSFLRRAEGDAFLDELVEVEGGRPARDAIVSYLDTYGMRCVGEIDIARPRWSEHPSALLPMILANVETFESGESRRQVERGRLRAQQKEQELLERLRALPDGAEKAQETTRMIDRLRTFIGYREYPKYGMVSRYFAYRQALLAEAERLVRDDVLGAVDEMSFLTFQELHDAALTGRVDHELIARRRAEFRSFDALTPPRVLTSDGEGLDGTYRRDDVPAGALVGLAVSGGVIEGRARVVFDVGDADLEPGDILVTPHTDPSWSPLFVAIAGLVTEVGGLLTHGAVVAREYGLAAVVGVEHATRRIQDGQRIRVDGTRGFVELLGEAEQ